VLLVATGLLALPLALGACGGSTSASAGGWRQVAELQGSDTGSGDELGSTVAISGSTAVAGSTEHGAEAGAAYVFTGSGGAWKQSAEPVNPDIVSFDQFGSSVAVSGSTLVVGAQDVGSQSGRAYVFAKAGNGWTQTAELKGSDTASYDEFGSAVAVSGSTIVVGAGSHDLREGRAYVLTESGTGWTQTAELKISDKASYDDFGSSVAVSGSTIVVGAYDHAAGAGRAYVFAKTVNRWRQTAGLKGSDTIAGDYFGFSVAVSGLTVVVGAEYHSGNAGRVYVFHQASRGWAQSAELAGSDTAANDAFGASVAVSGTTIVVGAEDHDSKAGEVYVFQK
jgi:hypothetical protein